MTRRLEICSSPVATVGYAVLAWVDLGADAASLFSVSPATTNTPTPAWATALRDAMRAHPRDGLALQGWPLRAEDIACLATPPVAAALAAAYAAGLREQPAPVLPAPSSSTACGTLQERLPALLAALWAPLGASAPTLRIVDCRPLGPHGRAVASGAVFTVATSLAEPGSHALLQVFHEAAHPVTDAAVTARLDSLTDTNRDTRRDTPGYANHRALEAAAVAYGTSVLESVAPDLLPAWAAWRARWGAA